MSKTMYTSYYFCLSFAINASNTFCVWGVHVRVIRYQTLNHLFQIAVGSNPAAVFDSVVRGSFTYVVLLGCPLVPGIMHGDAAEVFLHQRKLDNCRVT